MKNLINNIIGSFKTGDGGLSARKLTAFTSIMVAIYVTYTLPADMRLNALFAWQLLALLCLGIVTIEQIIKFKNENKL